ncbi:MAG: FtsX-like permease family protein [Rhodocyclaceae bacterium]|nr:FtsX-like permease family protein [Rhodocyclaceae bacterium]MBX3671141.1 FtsX-like permease family protein [Rhodocyclaceae bacterium]
MKVFLLGMVWRNAWRHKLRSALTLLGLVVALLAFGLLLTVVDAWYQGVNASSDKRLVTRHKVSLVFTLPQNYLGKIRAVDGVRLTTYENWFGGIYKEPKNFFPQFAVDARTYLQVYPEFRLTDAERDAFLRDRKGAIVGRRTAENYGLKVGDNITLKGTIFPGEWNFVLRGIYSGGRESTDESLFFFHWEYLDETVRQRYGGRRTAQIGLFVSEVEDADDIARIAQTIDAQFANSHAETRSETEKSFQLGFVAMSEALVAAIRAVSYLVILIILAVMANTMAMTARERRAEYATLRALGFAPPFLAALIFAESLLLALAGGVLAVVLTYPVAAFFGAAVSKFIPHFVVGPQTPLLQMAAALAVGLLAAFIPAWRAARVNIVSGLRAVA